MAADDALPAYVQTLGLSRDPFAPGDWGRYYGDAALRQRLDLLLYLVQSSDQLLVIKGPLGCGKSTLLRQFLGRAEAQFATCVVSADERSDASRILVAMAQAFADAGPEPQHHGESLAERLMELQRSGHHPLLVVDDAHLLSAEALRLILEQYEAMGEGGRLVRVVLFAESAIEALLDDAVRELKYRQDARTMDIPPFTEQQTEEYLQWRFQAAGLVGVPSSSSKTTCSCSPSTLERFDAGSMIIRPDMPR